jgi:hypothetical protein
MSLPVPRPLSQVAASLETDSSGGGGVNGAAATGVRIVSSSAELNTALLHSQGGRSDAGAVSVAHVV